MKTMHWSVAAVVAAAVAAGAWLWHAGAGRTTPTAGSAPLTMSIALNPTYAGSALVLIAKDKGYFDVEGIDVTLQPHSSGRASIAAALEGKADLGLASEVAYLDAVADGTPGTIVATVFRSANDHGLVADAQRGVEAPGDLAGKRIGVTVGTSGDFVLDGLLLRENLSPADVQVVNLEPLEMGDAFDRGEIDAAVTWEPVLGSLRDRLGGNARVFYSGGIYELSFNLGGRRERLEQRQEHIRRVLRALLRAEEFVNGEPEAAREAIAERTRSDRKALEAAWPNYQFRVTLDQSLLVALEGVSRWATRARGDAARAAPNFLEHLDVGALAAIKPDAVTVIH